MLVDEPVSKLGLATLVGQVPWPMLFIGQMVHVHMQTAGGHRAALSPRASVLNSLVAPSNCQVETFTGAGPSRTNVEQCLGVMVVQQTGAYCGFIRFMDHMIKSRPVLYERRCLSI